MKKILGLILVLSSAKVVADVGSKCKESIMNYLENDNLTHFTDVRSVKINNDECRVIVKTNFEDPDCEETTKIFKLDLVNYKIINVKTVYGLCRYDY